MAPKNYQRKQKSLQNTSTVGSWPFLPLRATSVTAWQYSAPSQQLTLRLQRELPWSLPRCLQMRVLERQLLEEGLHLEKQFISNWKTTDQAEKHLNTADLWRKQLPVKHHCLLLGQRLGALNSCIPRRWFISHKSCVMFLLSSQINQASKTSVTIHTKYLSKQLTLQISF